ncbi:hypothetical protein [Parabacteroides provencensis]|uniref:hypothetical protein n=1 Tax=Parabacteroides provencensis TaxID=1944636 RepID=UPI000C153577|nr:hypothetical protein [Parabacteroides provencensis]
METEDYNVTPIELGQIQIAQADTIERASVDSQVATAKQYPRDVRKCINNSIVIVTMDIETAKSCSYALSKGGKLITGPSVHLAKILATNWGNIRTEAKVIQITDKQIISRGTAWDLETNVASAFEVSRSIVDSKGKRYSNDMIVVTGNAVNSIAYRNAVFAVIPKAITDRVYQAAQKYITGDLSDADKLLKFRTTLINTFKNEYGISESEVIKLCGKQTTNQIKTDEITFLVGVSQSLKDGDTTVDDLMKPIRKTKEDITTKKTRMKTKKVDKLP